MQLNWARVWPPRACASASLLSQQQRLKADFPPSISHTALGPVCACHKRRATVTFYYICIAAFPCSCLAPLSPDFQIGGSLSRASQVAQTSSRVQNDFMATQTARCERGCCREQLAPSNWHESDPAAHSSSQLKYPARTHMMRHRSSDCCSSCVEKCVTPWACLKKKKDYLCLFFCY